MTPMKLPPDIEISSAAGSRWSTLDTEVRARVRNAVVPRIERNGTLAAWPRAFTEMACRDLFEGVEVVMTLGNGTRSHHPAPDRDHLETVARLGSLRAITHLIDRWLDAWVAFKTENASDELKERALGA